MTDPTMAFLAEEYLAYRRKLGFSLRSEGWELMAFARHADQIGHRGAVTTDLAIQWASLSEKASPLYRARKLDVVRRFAKHRAFFDPRTEIPPNGILGPSYRRPQPHIYSEDEIAALLYAASGLRPAGSLRPRTFVTLFGLLVSTGLRISEALSLKQPEVDLKRGVLTISNGKFHRDRLVPLHQSTTDALADYARLRIRQHAIERSTTFFLTRRGTPLRYWNVREAFRTLRRLLGWEGRPSPRVQDFRHTFAVRRLSRWYEEGADVDQKIASLSRYLGHVKVSYTYWYLSAVPELLAIASSRFEHYAEKKEINND